MTLEISQLTLAARSGVSLGTINKIEKAKNHKQMAGVGVGRLIALGKSLGVSASEVYPKLLDEPSNQW
jgi:transcriptional regulator with XRE-family HTH domain